jgi:cysteinyl-tRNA synthetase
MTRQQQQQKQPKWDIPVNTEPKLKLYNSLTKSKVTFVPNSGSKIKWYTCGPTVYDASHLGHARAYVTFDILRRVMEEYFCYDVLYQMNITDIDDKIILRARQNFLFNKYKKKFNSILTYDNWKELFILWKKFVEKNIQSLPYPDIDYITQTIWLTMTNSIEIKLKILYDPKFKMNFDAANLMINTLLSIKDNLNVINFEEVIETTRDVVVEFLELELELELELKSNSLEDHKIYNDLSSYWENEFFKDMDQLNVRRPDVVTRVTEYVPKIVTYIEKIIENGYAYESSGSVYFDTKKFDSEDKHFYAKLEPLSAFSVNSNANISTNDKRTPWDFALWKASKSNEPKWPSPWGFGRPGWHIECSVMASDILGESIDIHSGGIDLAFPHHDNEMAQAEAYYGCSQWVNYFLHAGHLYISGQKMSKSLKNYITIKDILKKYSSNQIRILFLTYNWYAPLDYNLDSMYLFQIQKIETNFKNFFSTVDAIIRENHHTVHMIMTIDEIELLIMILETQTNVHEAMCDSIDTPKIMDELLKLVSIVNVYINKHKQYNISLIIKAKKYIERILTIFGLVFENHNTNQNEETIIPLLEILATFRNDIRTLAREKKDPQFTKILILTDKLRDEDLPEIGVRLEDRDGANSLIKLEDRATLIKEKADKLRKKQEDKLKKLQNSKN